MAQKEEGEKETDVQDAEKMAEAMFEVEQVGKDVHFETVFSYVFHMLSTQMPKCSNRLNKRS